MRRIASLLLAASSVLWLTGSAQCRTRPRQGGTLRVEMRADASQWMNSALRMLVFDTLTQLDETGHPQPSLAVRWDSRSDDRRWQLWLRPEVRFHDGTPLSAITVVQSLTAQDCAGCPWRSVRVSGDSVVFESETPIPALPTLLANSRYAIFRKDDVGNIVGTGVFRFTAITSGAATFSLVEDSWHPRPFVSTIDLRGGRSLRDQWMDVGVGRADVVEVPAEQLRRAQQERMRLLVSRNSDLIVLVAEEKDPAAQDSRLLEALSVSVDRGALFNVVFQKQGEVTASFLPNWLTGYSFLFNNAANVTRARELRSQVERPSEFTLATDAGDSVLQLIADRLALNARDGGIVLRPLLTPSRSTLRLVRVHIEEMDAASAFIDVVGQLAPTERTAPNDVLGTFRREQELLARHAIIPLLYVPRAVAVSPRVHDLVLAPDGSVRAANFWVEDGK